MNKVLLLRFTQIGKTYFLTPSTLYICQKQLCLSTLCKSCGIYSWHLKDKKTIKSPEMKFSSQHSENGVLKRLKKKLFDTLSHNSKISIGACLTYENCADNIAVNEFLKYFKLPDTFYSWFLVIQIHVWMLALVTVSEQNGKAFRNQLIDAMWNDVEQRMEHLAEMRSSTKKKYLEDLVEKFNASLISYDEGILDDDKTLAAALWRSVYAFDKNLDPRLLECFVLYIRKQVHHLDALNSEELMFRGAVSFLPLKDAISEIESM